MNGLPESSAGRPRSSGGSTSKASPTGSAGSPRTSKVRSRAPKRRLEHADDSSSSGSGNDDDGTSGRKRLPGVKRACNECRQQKLKCDVITEPEYIACERCRRLRLQCRIDSNFKRVGKRSRHAEMEREIEELKSRLAGYTGSNGSNGLPLHATPLAVPNIKTEIIKTEPIAGGPPMDSFMGSEEAVASLMDMASGQEGGSFLKSPHGRLLLTRRIGDVTLSQDQVDQLFQTYFTYYHPFLPILDPTTAPDSTYDSSKLLFWVIVGIAARKSHSNPLLLTKLAPHLSSLLWDQVREIPQNYLFVKALCLLCTWPLPVSSTSADQTYMLSGVNMHVAMAIGLHRPSHVQDFSKFKADLMEEELRDRVRTWAACNAVAQRVATGYGQPPTTFYDWTLEPKGAYPPGFILPKDAQNRLLIERFSSRITQMLYRNDCDMVGLANEETRLAFTKMCETEYQQIGKRLINPDQFSWLYLKAAYIHFRLSIFFADPTANDYNDGLLALWNAVTDFLNTVFGIKTAAGDLYQYSTNYILQIMLASAFTLLKLLNSFFATYIDQDQGRKLLTRTIRVIREISIPPNDLPSRLAEVLSQLWKGSAAATKRPLPATSMLENSLQLKVKCRMSMSLVFDSVWRWREEFQSKGRGNLEAATKNPTNLDSNVESSATSVTDQAVNANVNTNNSLMPGGLMTAGNLTPGLRAGTPQPEGWMLGHDYNEVFDPISWMFDGHVDFPYSSYGTGGAMMPGMEQEESL